MSAKVSIAEVEEIVDPGELDPSHIHTPGIFVNRVVKADPVKVPFMASKDNVGSFWQGFKEEVTDGKG